MNRIMGFALNNREKILEKISTNFSKTIFFGFMPRLLYLRPKKSLYCLLDRRPCGLRLNDWRRENLVIPPRK